MTLAMASVGDIVAPRERGRYQGYIAAVVRRGDDRRAAARRRCSWSTSAGAGSSTSTSRSASLALAGLRLRLPAAPARRPSTPLDAPGAACSPPPTGALMLACIWGGERYAWGSATIVGLLARGARPRRRARRARAARGRPDRAVRPAAHPRPCAVASAALFLATAALFAINVFVPLFLQVTTGATPTEAGLLLVPAMLGITLSTNLAGPRDRAHRAATAPTRSPASR